MTCLPSYDQKINRGLPPDFELGNRPMKLLRHNRGLYLSPSDGISSGVTASTSCMFRELNMQSAPRVGSQ